MTPCAPAGQVRDARGLAELEVEGRIGIATGEVVTGTEERFRDRRCRQCRRPPAARQRDRERCLSGKRRSRLLASLPTSSRLDPLALKGKAEPVPAYRLIAVREVGRRPATRFVGCEGSWRRFVRPLSERWRSDAASS